MKNILLSVIIPAFNEEENFRHGALFEVWQYLKQQKYRWEVIIVDDGSTDSTPTLVAPFAKEHKGFSLLQIPHRGKAGAIIAGFKKTKGEILLFTDFDQSVPIGEIEKVLPLFGNKSIAYHKFKSKLSLRAQRSNLKRSPRPAMAVLAMTERYDVVIGSRVSRKGAPLIRKITGYGFIILQKLLLGLPYQDTQCGFKAFTKEAAGKITKRMVIFSRDTKQKGYAPNAGFDLEILIIAHGIGLKVVEVPVKWVHKEKNTFNALKVSFLALCDMINIRRVLY